MLTPKRTTGVEQVVGEAARVPSGYLESLLLKVFPQK